MGDQKAQGLEGGMLAASEQIAAVRDGSRALPAVQRRLDTEQAAAARQQWRDRALPAVQRRLAATESLAIGGIARGANLGAPELPEALSGIQNGLRTVALGMARDFTQRTALDAAERFTEPLRESMQRLTGIGAAHEQTNDLFRSLLFSPALGETLERWTSEQIDTLQAAIRVGDEVQRSLLYLEQWAEEQRKTQERALAAVANLGRGWRSVWPEPAPRRQPYLPEPEPSAEQIETVQTDDQLTLESIAMALKQGKLPARELIRLCLQHVPTSKPGRKEPPISEQLSIVEGWYAVKGRMLQQLYCDKVGISRASLNRYERMCKALGLI